MANAAILFVLLALLVLDCMQTITIVRNPHRWYERNPILKRILDRFPRAEHEAVVYCWFAAGVLLAAGLAIFDWWAVTGLWVLAEIYCVANNHFKGIRPSWN